MNCLIAELRRKKNLSQYELAEAVGISVASLRRYENNIIEPKMSIQIKIAQVLDVDVSCLMDYNKNTEI